MSESDPFSKFRDDKTVIRPSPGKRIQLKPLMPAENLHGDSGLGERYAGAPEPVLSDPQGAANPLIDSAFSLISLVPKLRALPIHDAIDGLRKNLIGEIKKFEDRALRAGAPPTQVETAKYFICSLIDEAVLNTPWGSQSGWGHNSLSAHFFRKMLGGEEFFHIINRLKQQPGQNLDLLELAYLCLSLGFEGKYRYSGDGANALENDRQDIYILIQRIRGSSTPSLAIHWQGVQDLRPPLIRHVPLWVPCVLVCLVLVLVYFLGFSYLINEKSERVYGELAAMAQTVEKIQPGEIIQPIRYQRPPPSATNRFRVLLADEIAQGKVDVLDGPVLRIFDLFASGSAEIKSDFRLTLGKIAGELQKDPAISGIEYGKIEVIGHTDNQKIKFSSRFKSNYDLSRARARNAADLLAAGNSLRGRVNFEGRGDTEPLVPNDTKENLARNRRIDIKIQVR